jgi:hypothetical protein
MNRFALAGQWPESENLFLAHLQSPQFVAEADERVGYPRFFITLLPAVRRPGDPMFAQLMREGAAFFYEQITGNEPPTRMTVAFIEGTHRRLPPKFLLAITPRNRTFIIEPHQPGGIAEVMDWSAKNGDLLLPCFNATSQSQLIEMRQYYQEYLQRMPSRPA